MSVFFSPLSVFHENSPHDFVGVKVNEKNRKKKGLFPQRALSYLVSRKFPIFRYFSNKNNPNINIGFESFVRKIPFRETYGATIRGNFSSQPRDHRK